MTLLDATKIAELKGKHGKNLRGVELPNGVTLVFRKPSRMEYDRFTDTVSDSNKSTPARELAKSCLCFPDESALNEALDEYPALLLNEILLALKDLSGFVQDYPVKTL